MTNREVHTEPVDKCQRQRDKKNKTYRSCCNSDHRKRDRVEKVASELRNSHVLMAIEKLLLYQCPNDRVTIRPGPLNKVNVCVKK